MIFEFIISGFSIAGFTIIWRNWIEDHNSYKKIIEQKLGSYKKILLCGSCFTYWITLLFILIYNPIDNWKPADFNIINIFMSWMALAYISVFLRFTYVLVQQSVHNLVHTHNH
jgi:hypothetical protein